METVIPRSNDQIVMILNGRDKGLYGIMVDKIKGTFEKSQNFFLIFLEKERVMVEILPDKKRVERFTFDDVCQFNATKADFKKK